MRRRAAVASESAAASTTARSQERSGEPKELFSAILALHEELFSTR
jgi:hypothetical protein